MDVRPLVADDIDGMVSAFAAVGWPGKSAELFRRYLDEQGAGHRLVLVADTAGGCAGYLCVVWSSNYEPFRAAGIPEIADFNVLPRHRRRGVGTALMDAAETEIVMRSAVAGIGCGLYADYGAALLLYLKRGYTPDGRGITYDGRTVPADEMIRVDDSAALMLTKDLRPGG